MISELNLTDEDLLKKYLAEKNTQFLNILCSRYIDIGFRTANRYLNNASDAEDVLQISFIKLLQNLHTFRDGSITVKPWLMKIIINTSLKKIREDKRRKNYHQKAAVNNLNLYTSNENMIEATDEKAILKEKINNLIEHLPEKYRSPIWLIIHENLTYPEAAKVLALPEKTVRTQVSRGLEKLRVSATAIGYTISVAAILGIIAETKLEAAPFKAEKIISSPNFFQAGSTKSTKLITVANKAILLKIFSIILIGILTTVSVKLYFSNLKTENQAEIFPPLIQNSLLEKINGLPDNTWLKLPEFKVDGEIDWLEKDSSWRYRGPTIRDYCNKMVWAPELQKAFYCGGGYSSPSTNDVWEYDLAKNTWSCIYAWDWAFAGISNEPSEKNAELINKRIKQNGPVITTIKGAPLRPSQTWWGLAYDEHRCRVVLWDSNRGLNLQYNTLVAKAINSTVEKNQLKKAHMFLFNPVARKWDAWIDAPFEYHSSQLEYLPDTKSLWLSSGGPYLIDATNKSDWKRMKTIGTGPADKTLTAYDQESKTIVAIKEKNTYTYSFKTNQWNLVQNGTSPMAFVPQSTFCYDSFSKKFILITLEEKQLLWTYDLQKNEWVNPKPLGDIPNSINLACYYDKARNVTVLYTEIIEERLRKGRVFIYRCKQKQ